MSYDVQKIREDFPILSTQINGHELVYFDNGASAQKPKLVIDAVAENYAHYYANVHRGLHYLSNIATEKYESVREIVAKFLNAPEQNIVFTTGSTEALNLVSYSWGENQLKAGDEIILSVAEHHANIVPWHFLRERLGVQLVWVDIEHDGRLLPEAVEAAISPKTRLIALSHMSNVTGVHVDIARMAKMARAHNIRICVDGSQACVHQKVDLSALDVDFYAITGHKLYGPTGTGALYVSDAALADMRPFMGGGDMIDRVTKENVTYAKPPMRFEAGTPGIVEIIGFGVALQYLMNLGMDNIAAHENHLKTTMMARLSDVPNIEIYGTHHEKSAIFTFNLKNIHPHDLSTIVNEKAVALRAGTHCAQVLMEYYGVHASVRASLGLYNTVEEIDRFIEALHFARKLLG